MLKIAEYNKITGKKIELSELEDILNYLETTSLEPHDDYVSEFSYKEQKTLWKYIKDLRLENQELKKQLEAKNIQQKEFIDLLEGMYFETDDNWWFAILNKYKEIVKEVE